MWARNKCSLFRMLIVDGSYIRIMIKYIFTNAYSSAELEVLQKGKPDYKVMLICITVAFSLTMIKYIGDVNFTIVLLQGTSSVNFAKFFESLMTINKNAQLYRLLYWV